MQKDYTIEELTFQNSETVTYRARKRNGRPHTITRLNLPEKILTPLHDGQFRQACLRLIEIKHGCLREAADGGLDHIDYIPWIATKWWEGKLLSDQIKKQTLTGADIARIRYHGESLIHDVGDVAGAISFDPRTVVTTRSLEGEKVATFEFNYARWFTDWARGNKPGAQDNPYDNLNNLISLLEDEIEKFENTKAPFQEFTSPPETVPVLQAVATRPTLVTPPIANATETPKKQVAQVTVPKVSSLAPITAPTSGQLLPSAAPKKVTTPKKMAFIGSALAAIVVSAIIVTQQRASASSENESPTANNESSIEKNEHIASRAKAPAPTKNPAPKLSRNRKIGLPDRPEFTGEILDVSATSRKELADNVGDWAVINGRITDLDDKGIIYFADSSLQGFLIKGSAKKFVGDTVQVTGILTSAKTLRIEKASDVSVIRSSEEAYTLKDEQLLRTMPQEMVTLRGTAKGFNKTESGSSLYLVFHDQNGGFRAGISPEKSKDKIDEKWLRQFVGKEILITGRVTTFENAKDKAGKRLVIRFYRKSDIELYDLRLTGK